MQPGGGIGAAERGEGDGFGSNLRSIAGRWPDADALLQSGMSEGLRDWDLWGPLIFCLLLSLFLSWGAGGKQKDLVFSGVFAMVWIGEAVVTMQIKLLGGNMYVCTVTTTFGRYANLVQRLLPVRLHYRLHALPTCDRLPPQRHRHSHHRQSARVPCSHCMVTRCWSEHPGRQRCRPQSRWHRCIPSVCILYCAWLSLFHQLALFVWPCKSSRLQIPGVWVKYRLGDIDTLDAHFMLLQHHAIYNASDLPFNPL